LSSPKAIVTIQSEVVTGHVGNAAARFALQRLGHEAWGVPTVILSSHPGHHGFAGEATAPAVLQKLLDAMHRQRRLDTAAGILSGYLGLPEQAGIVATAVARVKANGTKLYCLDPAFGDDGRIYARPGVMEAMRDRLVPLADILTPNAFELATLSGMPVTSPDEAVVAATALNRPIVVATSVPVDGDRIGTLLLGGGAALLATTPKLTDAPRGAGDLLAALLFGHMLDGRSVGDALERAVQSTYHILSVSAGESEMALIAAQEALANPPAVSGFRVEMLETARRAHG
jgi:pyridoxine kinase